MKAAWVAITSLALILFSLTLFLTLSPSSPINPQGFGTPVPIPAAPYQPQVYGFLPFWNLSQTDAVTLSRLTDLLYFALTVDETGNLVTSDPGYSRFLANYSLINDMAQTHQLRLHLVIKALSDQDLFNFLHSETAIANLTQTLNKLTASYPVQGINLDFEPSAATDSATISRFTSFVKLFSTDLKSNRFSDYPINRLTIDIYPSAASSPKLWDLQALSPHTDYFIVMGYDYTQLSSPQAGPIAPMYPSPLSRHALIPNLAQISRFVPNSQVIIGLPLYGYEWQTLSPEPYAPVIKNSGRLATLDRIDSVLKSTGQIPLLDPQTLSTRLVYRDGPSIFQIHFDDPLVLRLKSGLAAAGNYAGLAFWAVGYADTVSQTLFNQINQIP